MHPEQLLKLWHEYREAKRPELAPTTYSRSYGDIAKRIAKLPDTLTTGKEYRQALLETYSDETARRTLVQINACCKWAVIEELITHNPLATVRIRVPKPAPSAPDAFSVQEMTAILRAMALKHPHYLPWTKALFWSGARPEELRALRWEHLSSQGRELLIKEAWPIDAKAPQQTKTRRTTRFPLNDRLTALFDEIRPPRPRREDWIFKSEAGRPFNYANFQRRQWRPVVEELVRLCEVSYYGPQYHARHTAITLMLRSGLSVEDVAYLTRTSRKIIFEHYAARSREIQVPEY